MVKLPDDVIGGAASFIAVILETAGLHAQADILENFDPAFRSLGALVYIWGIAGAIASIALWGNYKKGIFFLFCPAVFWWMIQTRDTTSGAIHLFGNRVVEKSQDQQDEILEKHQVKKVDLPKVSYFFKRYDRLVTSLVQQTVTLLVDTNRSQDLINEGREVAYRKLSSLKNWDSNYMNLLGHGLVGACHEMAQLQFELASSKYEAVFKAPGDFCAVQRAVGGGGKPKYVDDNTPEANINELEYEYVLKCKNLQILKQQKVQVHRSVEPYINGLETQVKYGDGQHYCGDVWEWIRVASIKYAKEIWDNPEYQQFAQDHPEVDWPRVYREVQKKFQTPGVNGRDKPANVKEATDMLAAFIFRNTVVQTPIGSIGVSQTGRGNWDPKLWRDDIAPIVDNEGRVQRLLIFHFASLVPYVQGVLLYLLSVAFPFFCFFLLLPERISSFFVWMTLWLWVKSWDVGFAFVHFFREIYWGLLPHLGQMRDLKTVNSFTWDPDKPEMMLSVILRNDPGAGIAVYYTVVSALTIAIPFVTAHLCMGASNLYDSLKTGIDGTATRFIGDVRREANRRYADRVERSRKAWQTAVAMKVKKDMQPEINRMPDRNQAAQQRMIARETAYQLYKFGHSDQGKRMHQQLGFYTGRLDPLQLFREDASLGKVISGATSQVNDMEHFAKHNLGSQGAQEIGFIESMIANDGSMIANTQAIDENPSISSGGPDGYKGGSDEPGDADGDGD